MAYGNSITYNNWKDIRIYKGHNLFQNSFAKEDINSREYSKKLGKCMGQSQRNISMLKGMVMCGSYFAVVMTTLNGGLTIGSMVKYAGAVYMLCENISTFIDIFLEFKLTCTRQQSSQEYLNYPPVGFATV